MSAISLLKLGAICIAGLAIIVFGGYDDSPGAQAIGLLIVVIGVFLFLRKRKSQ